MDQCNGQVVLRHGANPTYGATHRRRVLKDRKAQVNGSRMSQEALNEDANMKPQPLRRYGFPWVTKQEGKKWFIEHKELNNSHELFIDRVSLASEFPHIVERLNTLGIDFVLNDLGECNLNMKHATHVTRERARLVYALMTGRPVNVGLTIKDMLRSARTKDLEGIYHPVLYINEGNARIDNVLSHLYGMQMSKLRMNEPLDDDDAMNKEQTLVDSNLDSYDDGYDSKMGEAVFAPIDD
ncbi:hypothetical protein HAX54_027354 [Datura stramonium]|uniref:Uncharacterized protein n=1 Tax=Datura stramonium TaxID=4076 RepID=A0ABS8V2A0_DATST|nr:hypothetical protein [Datura stramonium]